MEHSMRIETFYVHCSILIPGRRGGSPAKQSPRVGLAKAEGPDRLCSDSKRDLASGRSEVNSSARKAGRLEDKGRESC